MITQSELYLSLSSPFADLKEMCELLGTEQSVLERAFSYRTVEAKMEKVSTTLNVAQVRGDIRLAPVLPTHICPTRIDTDTHTLAVHEKIKGQFFPLTGSSGCRLSSASTLHENPSIIDKPYSSWKFKCGSYFRG